MPQSEKQRLRFAVSKHGRELSKPNAKKPSLKDALLARKAGRGH